MTVTNSQRAIEAGNNIPDLNVKVVQSISGLDIISLDNGEILSTVTSYSEARLWIRKQKAHLRALHGPCKYND